MEVVGYNHFPALIYVPLDMEGACHRQVCMVVLGAHLVLLVLAALVICVRYMCVNRMTISDYNTKPVRGGCAMLF